jgi:alpha-ketoglutarate-dependent taurine dioxygenase
MSATLSVREEVPERARERAGEVRAEPLAGHIGAEIGAVDPRKPLSDSAVAAICGALLRWKVVFFRDVIAALNPPAGSLLRAEVVPYGGDTIWTNLVAAYQGLSEPLQRLADKLRAVHRFSIADGVQISAKLRERIAARPLVSEWAPGSIAFWDNRATAHLAPRHLGDFERRLYRVTLVGDVPVGPDGVPSRALQGGVLAAT